MRLAEHLNTSLFVPYLLGRTITITASADELFPLFFLIKDKCTISVCHKYRIYTKGYKSRSPSSKERLASALLRPASSLPFLLRHRTPSSRYASRGIQALRYREYSSYSAEDVLLVRKKRLRSGILLSMYVVLNARRSISTCVDIGEFLCMAQTYLPSLPTFILGNNLIEITSQSYGFAPAIAFFTI